MGSLNEDLDVESPPHSLLSFANQAFERVVSSTPNGHADDTRTVSFRKENGVASVSGKSETEKAGTKWCGYKQVRNSVFFGLLFLLALGLVALGMHHWTQQEHLDLQTERINATEEQVEMQKQLIGLKQHHLEWQRNESLVRMEHIELQRQMLAINAGENATLTEQLETAENALKYCRTALQTASENYWESQHNLWNMYAQLYALRRQLHLRASHVKMQRELLGTHAATNLTQQERIGQLEEDLEKKEEIVQALKIELGQKSALIEEYNETESAIMGQLKGKQAELEEQKVTINKLLEELRIAKLTSDSRVAMVAHIDALKDQLKEKDKQLEKYEKLIGAKEKEQVVVAKVHLTVKEEGFQQQLDLKEKKIAELNARVEGLQEDVNDKQKTINAKQSSIDTYKRCYYRSWHC